ncbi:hypothetical protein [uncultured Hyphomicrobium sp.]|uniref:hypothetical protein n=1 Tax=uncultured Hyphomicrobium sp. TaxID=194373 RepID=UPI0025EEED9C|nr:hypothetical protein [uncultured Hyphomicrobium sp.]
MDSLHEIICPHCKEPVAVTFASEPLPGIYHPACGEEQRATIAKMMAERSIAER